MAIRVMWYSVILPLEIVNDLKALLSMYDECIGTTVWYDSTLFAGSVMSKPDAMKWLEELIGGYCKVRPINGPRPCIAEAIDGPLRDCDWLDINQEPYVARRKGDKDSDVIGNEAIDQHMAGGDPPLLFQGRIDGSRSHRMGYVVIRSLKSGINITPNGSFKGWVGSSFVNDSVEVDIKQSIEVVDLVAGIKKEYEISFRREHDVFMHVDLEDDSFRVEYKPSSSRKSDSQF